MSTRITAECPLKVYIAASSDDLMVTASSFVRNLAGVHADVSKVDPEQLRILTKRAEPGQPELVVLAGPRDGSGVDGVDAPSIAMDSPIPVMVVHPPADGAGELPSIRRIVVPLDGSERAAQALPLATHMARGSRVPMHLVTIIDPSRVVPPAFAYDPDAFLLINELRETAHWALKQAETPLIRQGIEVEAELLYGPINATFQSLMQPDDLVVMTTHGTGRARSKIGSVAARILETAPCPVILHRGSGAGDVVVDGYEACSWVEPLSRHAPVNRG